MLRLLLAQDQNSRQCNLLVTELLDLANVYFESHLKRRCIQIIKQGITVLNVASLYSTAIEYNALVNIYFFSVIYIFIYNICTFCTRLTRGTGEFV